MKPLEQFLQAISQDRDLAPEVAHREDIPAREARWGDIPADLRPEVIAGLGSLGIGRLYSHQSEAVGRALAGEDLVVVTPTASGKTLCYNLPVLNRCLEQPAARALYLFPIKALEQDQLGSFRELAAACGAGDRVAAEIYDGDTPSHRREKIRRNPPSIVITNPDMLHLGMLAHHPSWEAFLRDLEFIVLDEVHTYRGVFGSHVAHVLRRLLRVAAAYGSFPRVIACSATIANPGELAAELLGRPVTVVDDNGSPEAGRRFLFVNSHRLSASTIASRLLTEAVSHELATIVFTKARKMTELIHTWTVQHDPRLRRIISAYRAGYLPEERREIEQALFSGKLKGVVTTSALEMGIDIGALDVCILVGYPGAVTTTWQRGGRVGRQDRESLIVLIAQQDALDQYFMKHPRDFFDAGFEPAVLDPGNRPILKAHLTCAAAEIPLRRDDPFYSSIPSPRLRGEGEDSDQGEQHRSLRCEGAVAGKAVRDDGLRQIDVAGAISELEREGKLLRVVGEDAWHATARNPQREVSIRGIGESSTIFEEPEGPAEEKKPRVIGSLDGHRVYSEGHPGAIYLHRGVQYQVTRLDLERLNLWARKVNAGYYTLPLREKETAILATRRSTPVKNFVARLGDLRVTERVTGYEKKRISSGERLSVHELDLPPYSFETVGFWIEIDDFIPRAVTALGLNFMGGIHAVEHAAIALFPLFALCERDDVGGISIPCHPALGKAAIFVYDGYPGGVGLAERSFERLEALLEKTLSLIGSCDCEKGCPACIYSNKCGNGNVPLDKQAAVLILSLLLDRPEARELMAPAAVPEEPPEEELEPVEEETPAPEAKGPRVLVLDIETRRGAAEVGGWNNTHLMGLAVAVVHDSRSGEFRSFFEEQAGDLLRELAAADLVVGFNLLGFDYKVLAAYDNGTLAKLKTFDMLYDIRRRLGYRLSLGHLAEHTLGTQKTADGLQSLEWVRQGRMDLVEEYCRHDVKITLDLFHHGLQEHWIRFRTKDGTLLELAVDWDLEKLATGAQ